MRSVAFPHMQPEELEIEGRGFERFIVGSVSIAGEPARFSADVIDPRGRAIFARFAAGRSVPLKAIARLTWKSSDDRRRCIASQGVRWADVEWLLRHMQAGTWDDTRQGPVFLHPSLTGASKLKPVDGARRIMARLEAGHDEFEVVVLRNREVGVIANASA